MSLKKKKKVAKKPPKSTNRPNRPVKPALTPSNVGRLPPEPPSTDVIRVTLTLRRKGEIWRAVGSNVSTTQLGKVATPIIRLADSAEEVAEKVVRAIKVLGRINQ